MKHSKPILLAIVCLVLSSVVNSAGFTTHNTAARRTSQFEYFGPESSTFNPAAFKGLARSRPDAVQGGAPFPDYLYTCGDDHDAGETAHWTPFQIAAANYIRSTYPNWSTTDRAEAGPGLVAFMLGVTSHYIADMNWHGLETVPSGEGIIRTMGFADFNCTNGDLCGVAHSAADTGGEFAAAKSLDLKWYPEKWYMPTTDLVNIYGSMNISVSESWIKECAVIFYAGSFAISRLGDLIYDHIIASRVGAVLLEEYIDFPVGGVDDDAAWTGFMWNRFAGWVANGPPDVPPNRQASGTAETASAPAGTLQLKHKSSQKKFVTALRAIFQEQGFFPLAENSNDGHFIQVDQHTVGSINSNFIRLKAELTSDSSKYERVLVAVADALVDDYALDLLADHTVSAEKVTILKTVLRTRVMNLNKSQTSPSPQSAAGVSTVDVALGPKEVTPVKVTAGDDAHAYHGSSITVADFSGTGQSCDVLIGSYGVGRGGGPQEGSATIHFGLACNDSFLSGSSPSPSPSSSSSGGTLTFRGGMMHDDPLPSYERFGWASAAADVNGDSLLDAIICAPSFGGRNVEAVVGNYSGRCDVFLGPFSSSLSGPLAPQASIYGDKAWGLFGSSIVVGDLDSDGVSDIVIGAPGAGSYPDIAANERGDVSSQGAVFIFRGKSLAAQLTKRSDGFKPFQASELADYVLQKPDSFQYFGRALSIDPLPAATLLVGAPFTAAADGSHSAVGKIYAFNVPHRATTTSKSLDHSWSLTGSRHAGRTGQAFAFSSSLGLLAVAEPAYNHSHSITAQDKVPRRDTLRAGRVTLIPLKSILQLTAGSSNKDLTMSALQSLPEVKSIFGDEKDERFGYQLFFSSATASAASAASTATTNNATAAAVDRGLATDMLVVASPLASAGGRVSAFQVSKVTGLPALARASWTATGASAGESLGRLGYRIQVVHTLTGASYVLASAPLADFGGVAPDADQRGGVFAIVL